MKNKLIRLFKIVFPIALWLSVWQIVAIAIDFSFLFPDVPETFKSLWTIITKASTYKVLLLTLKRVFLSLIFGTVFGGALAIASAKLEPVRIAVAPAISVMKSTPVAVIAVLLYSLFSGDAAPVVVALLMIMPVIWQNLMDGYNSIDRNLWELCDAYEFSFKKRLRFLILPALLKYFVPAFITSVGLSWKAVISAEILVHTIDSVGDMIYQSKYQLDTASVFAWTVIIIAMSIALEKLVQILLRRCKKCN